LFFSESAGGAASVEPFPFELLSVVVPVVEPSVVEVVVEVVLVELVVGVVVELDDVLELELELELDDEELLELVDSVVLVSVELDDSVDPVALATTEPIVKFASNKLASMIAIDFFMFKFLLVSLFPSITF
jgi:hypothetical protein